MNNMNSQNQSQKSNKSIILFIVGGVILLIATGLVYFVRNNQDHKSEPMPTQPTIEEPQIQLAPLVIKDNHKLLTLQNNDAGTSGGIVKNHKKTPIKKTFKTPAAKIEKTGKIDVKAVNKFINARFGQVRNCYERSLKKNAMLSGQLDLNINLSSKGKATHISVNNDTVRDATMLTCVKKVIRRWDFPKPEGGRVVIAKSFQFKKKL